MDKPLLQNIIFKIGLIPQPLMGKLHMNIGRVKSLFFIISKVFKCIAYAHAYVLDDTSRKLEPKSVQCVFFGYGKNTRMKGYKLYNLATQKSFYNQDVIFDEHSMALFSKSTNVSTTFTSMSKLESNLMPLMDDQDHTAYYFEDDSLPTSN
jgi:hypothetical protein